MENLPGKPSSIEQYLEDTIYQYLKSQDEIPESYPYDFGKINEQILDVAEAEEKQKALLVIEELVEDLLQSVDNTILYQEEYQKAYKKHNQYDLFELADILPEFVLDDTLMRKMCFREILLISNVDQPVLRTSDGSRPQGVGGMCLKVELARGIPPVKPPITEDDLNRNIAKRIQKIKQGLKDPSGSDDNGSEQDKLKKYEEFLQEESKKIPKKFMVHLSSEFDVDGQNAGSKIVSWVDKNMHTLEERRTEYAFREDKTSTQQILYYALQDNKYFVKHQVGLDKTSETRKYYPLSKTSNMIGEGANFILMRYLAITKFQGTFEMSAIYINGDMCRNIYECTGPEPGHVNRHAVDLCKIYRSIIEECGIIHLSVTVMTVYGLIVSQEWSGCPYIIHINPMFATHGKPVPYDSIALKNVWKNNMDMVSKYLDCKVEAEFKMKTYLKDHPEVYDMIADYLQSVLLLKPENIMPFTADYFMNFEPYSLPQMSYFNEFGGDNQNFDNTFW